jgi:uncharacterized metal-binding protein
MKVMKDQIVAAILLYQDDPDVRKMIIASVNTEGKGARKWTRVEDTIDFARQMGYRKLGIATCHGLLYEASVLTKILESNGFEVVSVGCKCGGMSKESLGVEDTAQRNAMPEAGLGNPSCNPVGQAFILNDEETDLNIIVGLCVGHDTLFIKHSKAPVTTFVTKDRRLFHNAAGALYGTPYYFRYLLSPIVLR